MAEAGVHDGRAEPAPTVDGAVPSDAPVAAPLVTVVVPCRNEEAALPDLLDSIGRQTLADFEALIIDGGSSDRSRCIVEKRAAADPRFRLLDNPRGIVPTGLNIGLGAARGTWLIRIDAHCVVPDDYLERLVVILEGGAGGAGGRKLGVGRGRTGRAIAAAMSSKAGVGRSEYHHDGEIQTVDHVPFGAYPVDLARQVGGWNEALSVNQDFEFDLRVRATGAELVLDPSIVIEWESRQTFHALFRQYRRYGRGKTRVMRLHPASVRPRHLVAPAFVAAAILLLLPVPVRWWRPLRRSVLLSYGMLVVVAGWLDGGHLPAGDRPRVTTALVVMHVGWGLGFWEGVYDHVVGRADRAIVDRERLGVAPEVGRR